jgi:hypothetical protein
LNSRDGLASIRSIRQFSFDGYTAYEPGICVQKADGHSIGALFGFNRKIRKAARCEKGVDCCRDVSAA